MLFDREGWLVLVEEAGEIAAAVEANDVEADEYVALGALGRALELSVRYQPDRPRWRSAQEIEISASATGVNAMTSVRYSPTRSGRPPSSGCAERAHRAALGRSSEGYELTVSTGTS